MFKPKSTLSVIILLFAAQAQAQFGPATIIDTSTHTFTHSVKVLTADINGDGRPDIMRATTDNNKAGNISYYLNNGTGGFSAATQVAGAFSHLSDFTFDDYNTDGRPDLLILDKRAAAMYVYLNAGGTFPTRVVTTSSKFTKNMATIVESGDFTGDGRPDVLVKDHIDVFLFAGLGNGLFDSARSLIPQALQTEMYHLVSGNFNGDAFKDFAVSTSGFMTFLNDGSGQFTLGAKTNGSISFLMAPGDLNGDGVDDMLMKDHETHIMMNDGLGTFTETGLLKPANYSYRAFAIGDMDGDGDKDVYSVYDQANRAVWFKNNGGGVLDSQVVIHDDVKGGMYSCALAELNGDSRPDLIWANFNGHMGVHLSAKAAGISSSEALNDVQIYPNPASNEVWIETRFPVQLLIADALGRTMGRSALQAGQHSLMLPNPDGLYFIRISTKEGTRTVKLIKESRP